MRGALAALPLLAPPAAAASWPACDSRDLTPPVPLKREAPAYPPAVREIGVEGWVEVALTVLRDGRVGWVQVLRAEPPGYFEQAASASVRQWRYRPAQADGEPAECRLRTRVRFALADTVRSPDAGGSGGGRPQPVYPRALLEARIEGYAEVEFELADGDRVSGARVINAMPRREFESAALAAVRRWRPDAATLAEFGTGRMTRRFEFRLPDSTLADVPAATFASAPFPAEACAARISGRVELEVDTDATGRVRTVRILASQPAGLFDAAALAIARGSRLTPAYRNGEPIAATALLTLPFDIDRVRCPGAEGPDPQQPPSRRPPPRVSQVDEWPAARAGP